MFPFTMLIVVLSGRAILQAQEFTTAVLNIAVPLLLSLAAIRFLVYGLRKGFPVTPMLKAWENIIGFTIWALVALHLLGWLPAVLEAMDELAVNVGSARISLLSSLKLVMLIGLLMTLAFWISGVLERRMKASTHVTPALQVALAKFSKFFLLTLAFLLALNAVGIDFTALTVFGGALGVGIGFGLQRIASNFISGFILVLDRSIKPGDVISIGDKFGWVEELRARYIVVRNRDGVETLIPNENLITSEVINWSYTDRHVRVRIPVQISYNDDPEQAMALMLEAASAAERVVADPAPTVRLQEFADNGILLELRVWIDDPEAGVGGVRSAINLAIWRAFKQAGISFPYPQRDLYIKEMPRG
jgi:Small-conductance mechanosensitive channel